MTKQRTIHKIPVFHSFCIWLGKCFLQTNQFFLSSTQSLRLDFLLSLPWRTGPPATRPMASLATRIQSPFTVNFKTPNAPKLTFSSSVLCANVWTRKSFQFFQKPLIRILFSCHQLTAVHPTAIKGFRENSFLTSSSPTNNLPNQIDSFCISLERTRRPSPVFSFIFGTKWTFCTTSVYNSGLILSQCQMDFSNRKHVTRHLPFYRNRNSKGINF